MLRSTPNSTGSSADEVMILVPASVAWPDVAIIPVVKQIDNLLRRVRNLHLCGLRRTALARTWFAEGERDAPPVTSTEFASSVRSVGPSVELQERRGGAAADPERG